MKREHLISAVEGIILAMVPYFLATAGQVPPAKPTQPPWTASDRWDINNLNNPYPNPQMQPDRCRRDGASWVCDPNNLVDEAIEDAMDDTICGKCSTQCRKLEQCGNPYIAVAVMKSIKAALNQSPYQAAVQFAEHLAADWHLGKLSAMIVVSRDDKTIGAVLSSDAETLVSNGCESVINSTHSSVFNDGDNFQNNLDDLVTFYSKVLKNEHDCNKSGMFKTIIIAVVVVLLVVIILVTFIVVYCVCCRGDRRGQTGQSRTPIVKSSANESETHPMTKTTATA